MNKIKLGILFGGCSTEYEVSLKSAYAVITHLNPERYDIALIGITRQGTWLTYDGSPERIADDTWHRDSSCLSAAVSPSRDVHGLLEWGTDGVQLTRLDAVFPILHGKNGEDGTVQGLLELAGIPIVGCGTLASAMCMDKDIAHTIVQAAGVEVPRSITVRRGAMVEEVRERITGLAYPLFVKPARAGSSYGVSKVDSEQQLMHAVETAWEHDSKTLIEQAVEGFEVGCSIIGEDDELLLGQVDEIELSQGFFDYTEKYTLQSSRIHMPARIDAGTAERIKQAAAVVYRALECSGFARVDLFLTPEGKIVFNEVNSIPGFTAHSRFPNMLKGIGMSFEQLLDRVIGMAVRP